MSALIQVMACYLSRCWLLIRGVLCHSTESNFTVKWKLYSLKLLSYLLANLSQYAPISHWGRDIRCSLLWVLHRLYLCDCNAACDKPYYRSLSRPNTSNPIIYPGRISTKPYSFKTRFVRDLLQNCSEIIDSHGANTYSLTHRTAG